MRSGASGTAAQVCDVVVACRDVGLSLGGNPILKGVDLALLRRRIAVVFGRTGSGKTTLLKCIAGYLAPTRGSVDVAAAPASEAARVGGELALIEGFLPACLPAPAPRGLLYAPPSPSAMMFADDANLLPQLTAAENLMLALAPRSPDTAARRAQLSAALALVGLSSVARHKPSELSTGQKRRLSLAQCLIRGPELIVLDEPTSGLDTRTKFDMLSLIQDVQARAGITGLVVTHDIDTVLMLSDDIIYFDDGKVQEIEVVDIPKPRKPEDFDAPRYTEIRRRVVDFLMSRALA